VIGGHLQPSLKGLDCAPSSREAAWFFMVQYPYTGSIAYQSSKVDRTGQGSVFYRSVRSGSNNYAFDCAPPSREATRFFMVQCPYTGSIAYQSSKVDRTGRDSVFYRLDRWPGPVPITMPLILPHLLEWLPLELKENGRVNDRSWSGWQRAKLRSTGGERPSE
jgi:hypothetical protein